MENRLRLKEILLQLPAEKRELASFLGRHGLSLEDDLLYAVALADEEDRMVACGACNGRLLKCFAVEQQLRGTNALGKLVSALTGYCMRGGCGNPQVVTRPHNVALFEACGFHPVAQTEDVALLEHLAGGADRFAESLTLPKDAGKKAGAIVLNANPFTMGHRYLIEHACARCEVLHLFVVQEDRSVFPFEDRFALVREGVADLPNVRVHKGGPYIISSATFPRYFLKASDDASAIQTKLDAAVFAERIAPALNITIRFVGTEPGCALTESYNRALANVLPQRGIELQIVSRLNDDGGAFISASRVRRILSDGADEGELARLLPPCTLRYLKSEKGAGVADRLRRSRAGPPNQNAAQQNPPDARRDI